MTLLLEDSECALGGHLRNINEKIVHIYVVLRH